jgi:hypothetical protein
VTSTALLLRAWPAIRTSCGPIGVPACSFGHIGRIALQRGNDCAGIKQEHQSSETSSEGGIEQL